MAVITFENPLYLWYLLSIPMLIASHFYFLRYAKYKGMRFANFQALKRISGENIFTKNYSILGLRTVILLCLIFSISGITIWYSGVTSNADYVLAIDVSASMTSIDLEPTRIDAAVDAAEMLVDRLQAERTDANVGVLTFSGATYIEEPLTNDFSQVKESLAQIDIRQEGGTDMSGAIVTGTNLLIASRKEGRAIIMISDGSVTVSSPDDMTFANSLAYANDENIVVHTLGMGSNTAPLGYLPEYYNVSSVFSEETMFSIANSTGGRYWKMTSSDNMTAVVDELVDLGTDTRLSVDLSYGMLLIAVLLIFLEWGLVSTRFRRLP